MAFAGSVTRVRRIGPMKLAYGTWTQGDADAGGSIATGLNVVQFFVPVCSSHLAGEDIKITKSAGTVTIVTSNGVDGDWFAIGH